MNISFTFGFSKASLHPSSLKNAKTATAQSANGSSSHDSYWPSSGHSSQSHSRQKLLDKQQALQAAGLLATSKSAPATAMVSPVQSTTLQSTTLQSTTLQSTTLQSTTLQSTTLQSTTLQSTTLQSTTLQSTTLQSTTLQSTTLKDMLSPLPADVLEMTAGGARSRMNSNASSLYDPSDYPQFMQQSKRVDSAITLNSQSTTSLAKSPSSPTSPSSSFTTTSSKTSSSSAHTLPSSISVLAVEKMKRSGSPTETSFFYTIQAIHNDTATSNCTFLTRSHQDFWSLHLHLLASLPDQHEKRSLPYLEKPPSSSTPTAPITRALHLRKLFNHYLSNLLTFFSHHYSSHDKSIQAARSLLHHFLLPSSCHDYSSPSLSSSGKQPHLVHHQLKQSPLYITDSSSISLTYALDVDAPLLLPDLYLLASRKTRESVLTLFAIDEFGRRVLVGGGKQGSSLFLEGLRVWRDRVDLYSCR